MGQRGQLCYLSCGACGGALTARFSPNQRSDNNAFQPHSPPPSIEIRSSGHLDAFGGRRGICLLVHFGHFDLCAVLPRWSTDGMRMRMWMGVCMRLALGMGTAILCRCDSMVVAVIVIVKRWLRPCFPPVFCQPQVQS